MHNHNLLKKALAVGIILLFLGASVVPTFSGYVKEKSDIEVVNDEKGKPEVRLYGKTSELLRDKIVHLSIAHSKDSAIAMVVVL